MINQDLRRERDHSVQVAKALRQVPITQEDMLDRLEDIVDRVLDGPTDPDNTLHFYRSSPRLAGLAAQHYKACYGPLPEELETRVLRAVRLLQPTPEARKRGRQKKQRNTVVNSATIAANGKPVNYDKNGYK